jgi:hypothetical protein
MRLHLLRVEGMTTTGPRTLGGERTGVEIRIPNPWYELRAVVRLEGVIASRDGAALALDAAIGELKRRGGAPDQVRVARFSLTETVITLGRYRALTGAHGHADQVAADIIGTLNDILAGR